MQWNRRIVFILIALCILAIFTVQGATPCPKGCTCLSPASALKMGYTTYCGGKQVICDYDVQKNPLYCYQNPEATCPADCLCLNEGDAKEKGYPLCGGIKTLCGYDSQQDPLYCYEKIVPTTAIQYFKCPADSVCYSPYEAKSLNLKKDPNVSGACGYSEKYQSLMECYLLPPPTPTPTPAPSDLSITQIPEDICPSACTCMAPTEAEERRYAPCPDMVDSCGYSSQYSERMYCYLAMYPGVVTPVPGELSLTQAPPTTTSTSLPLQLYHDICPSTCTCMAPTEAEERGFAACPDVVDSCGYSSQYSERMYCYLAVYTAVVTTAPEPVITEVSQTMPISAPIPLLPLTAIIALAGAIFLARGMKK